MVLNFAHRGSLTEAPENTIPSFEKALAHQPKGMELDVQLTKDQELVICHDAKLTRFNKNSKKMIQQLTWEEIQQIDIGSSFNEKYKGLHLCRLEDVLSITPPEVILNVEIKNIPVIYPGIEKRLLDCLEKYHRLDNVIISSFDHMALQNISKLHPALRLGMLFHYRILNTWKYAQASDLPIYSIHPNQVYVDQTFVQSCKEARYLVYPYTVNDKDRYEQLLSYGVDGVFSNNPEIFQGQ
ncbi:glycerophosphodiester phosphodiesterase family protein [Oceanobacillus sp. J11TS1]|uniref:glycerophosphodiester phosphodiesterase n=1 Tax=Oceanobacillus sp. J11TS1 TaxID=2807191 RepID=UPI001B05DF48|nr:glycerophosphodiester phosphodiesterase family protein [Oceanobacillus sp. J11TS1]GIO23413.1 glycerophosphoryl diester phosphodiesterase [Oceanobacillus sp. J11TS1]